MRPSMAVRVGDRVRLGDTLFEDKRNPGVPFTAAGAGEVVYLSYGEMKIMMTPAQWSLLFAVALVRICARDFSVFPPRLTPCLTKASTFRTCETTSAV